MRSPFRESLGGTPGDNLDAHHIVPGKADDPTGAGSRSREILDKYQIDINSADNGKLLVGGTGAPQNVRPRRHRGSDLHSYKGIQAVAKRLEDAIEGINDWATAREVLLADRVARPPLAVGLRSNKTYAPCGFHRDWKY